MAASGRPLSLLRDFLRRESAAGLVLMVAAALALGIAQSAAAPAYFALLSAYVGGLSVLHWVNDGLMAVFFLLVGLEIKREVLDGQLSTWRRRVLPGAAALAGMAVPAIFYVALNRSQPEMLRGWAIPTATDIAFALGVLALLGSRVPGSLKVFLTALAILDDLGAVLVIALFYAGELSVVALVAAAGLVVLLMIFNSFGVRALAAYLVVGLALWFFTLRSGVHASIAGVVLAATIPLRPSPGGPDDPSSPLHRLEHALHGWVAFVILPIFAFANSGVSLAGVDATAFAQPVTLGIFAGLFLGKQLGVFGACWLALRAGWAEPPLHASWRHLYGVAVLCGVGFTMSLFIGALAFGEAGDLARATKVGVFAGSLASALVGAAILLPRARPGAGTDRGP
jgi:NhaA family Na+:H+ antiporter